MTVFLLFSWNYFRAAAEGLEVTLMDRLIETYGSSALRMLTVQYRMNDVIMAWASKELYDSKLTAHDSVAQHLLRLSLCLSIFELKIDYIWIFDCFCRDLPGVSSNDDTETPVVLIDTSGCGLNELRLADEDSKANEGEANIVEFYVKRLVGSGVKWKATAWHFKYFTSTVNLPKTSYTSTFNLKQAVLT